MACAKDDLGIACQNCICKYTPVIAMASHRGRDKIATMNISGYSCKSVVLRNFPDTPLGAKWQEAVNQALKLNANPLIILGSDDFLSKTYIKTVLEYLAKGFDMVGCTSWYTYDVKSKKLYRMRYKNINQDFPVGSGKAYSGNLIQSMNYKIFDRTKDRRLDDYGHKNALMCNARIHLIREPEILAVKSGFGEMNPTFKYLQSPNIESILVKDQEEVFNKFHYVL